MAAILERLARDVEKTYPGLAESLRKQAQLARDLGVRESFSIKERKGSEIKPLTFLEQATKEYQANPTPESITQFYQAFWMKVGEKIHENITVSPFSKTDEELKNVISEGGFWIFKPHKIGFNELCKAFPKMKDHLSPFEMPIINVNERFGWIPMEVSKKFVRPQDYGDPFDKAASEFSPKDGSFSLEEYVIGGQINKLLNNRYFDDVYYGNYTLLSSFYQGEGHRKILAVARFEAGGCLDRCTSGNQGPSGET